MPDTRATPRREFIGQLASSATLLAAGACAPAVASSGTAASPRPGAATASQTAWDDSWFGRLTAKHKAVFDSPQIEDGLAVQNATFFINGMRDALGAGVNDVQAVVVIRHRAIPMAFNDAMWAKYPIGDEYKVKEPGSDAWATHNIFLAASPGRATSAPTGGDRPRPNLQWLAANGHVLLGCDLATRNMSGALARRINGNRDAIYAELKANVVPGLILQPTGVYACIRAQEAGCAYVRST